MATSASATEPAPAQAAPLTELAGHNQNGKKLVSGSNDTTLRVWDVGSRRQIGDAWRGHEHTRWAASGGNNKTVHVWDGSGEAVAVLEAHCAVVQSVDISPDRRRIAFGSLERDVRVWNVEDAGNPTFDVKHLSADYDVNCVRYSPDGQRLAVLCHNIFTLHVETGSSLEFVGIECGQAETVEWTPDSSQLVVGGFRETDAYDVSTRKCIRTWKAHGNDGTTGEQTMLFTPTTFFHAVAYSPLGDLIATASNDDRTYLWQAPPEVAAGEVFAVARRTPPRAQQVMSLEEFDRRAPNATTVPASGDVNATASGQGEHADRPVSGNDHNKPHGQEPPPAPPSSKQGDVQQEASATVQPPVPQMEPSAPFNKVVKHGRPMARTQIQFGARTVVGVVAAAAAPEHADYCFSLLL
ncbi:WD40 repeat-like protein [Gyrodon lividus]|nr:WD40 repeat-like protein [Gyrodon lividus]